MTRRDKRELRCRNSWRPSDGPPVPRLDGTRRRSSELQVSIQRSSPMQLPHGAWAPSDQGERSASAITPATPERPPQPFKNPNLMPIAPRRSHVQAASSLATKFQQDREQDEERLPQIWSPSIDDLIRRTAHDYDLVMNYERDAEGGQRWLPEDVAVIRKAGKRLHRDIFALKHLQRVVAEQGDRDKDMMVQIKRAANLLKLECERIQRAINTYEQKCEFELLRDGVYAQDEEGKFYRPATPPHYAAGDDAPKPSRKSVDHGETRSPENTYDFSEEPYGDYCTHISRFQTPPEDLTLSQTECITPSDFAIQNAAGFGKVKLDRVRQRSGDAHPSKYRRSDRVLDGRISKSYQTTPSARQRRSSLPTEEAEPLGPDSRASLDISEKKSHRRGRNNIYERDGRSRRQARKDREQARSPRPTAGHLGKHVLHY